MFRKYLQPKILFKNASAALLVLTLSGAYCFFCCQAMIAASAKADHCPPNKIIQTEHCNFSKNKSPETTQTAASVNAFECCGLKFSFFVAKLEKNEFPAQTPVLVNNFSGFLRSVKSENNTGLTDFSYRAPVSDHRDRRVKNCVFRI